MSGEEMSKEISPARLSQELREAQGESMERRRKLVGLSFVAVGAMGVIAAYQTGIINHLPEPPLPLLDADRVDASSEAYEKLSMPDGVLGLASYAVTMALVAMGGQDRANRRPWIPLAMAAKVATDAVQAGRLTLDQWTRHRAFCSYCLMGAAATFAMVPLAIPEARAALRQITS